MRPIYPRIETAGSIQATARDGGELVERAPLHRPDIIIIADVNMPVMPDCERLADSYDPSRY
jgi:CheY-like chemotaxis protein